MSVAATLQVKRRSNTGIGHGAECREYDHGDFTVPYDPYAICLVIIRYIFSDR